MNDFGNREQGAAAALAEVATAPSRQPRLRPLLTLVPFVMRYRGMMIAVRIARARVD